MRHALLPVPSSLQELVASASARSRTRPDPCSSWSRRSSARRRPACEGARGDPAAEALVDAAVLAGAIGVGDDDVVRFTHPLLGSAVYYDMPPSRRRAVHREAAGLVDNVEQQARHLALATSAPDDAIADVVERAAAAAAERGAPDAAAALQPKLFA